jgi:hypothetical protein
MGCMNTMNRCLIIRWWFGASQSHKSNCMQTRRGGKWATDECSRVCWQSSTVMTANIDREEVKPSGVNMHRRGGSLLCIGTTPSIAEGTTGIEPAGGAAAARLEAFGLGAYGKLSME